VAENRGHTLICSVIISLPCGVAVSSLKLVVPRAWCLIWFFLDFSALCRCSFSVETARWFISTAKDSFSPTAD
jgi:hypothetical protein